MSSARSIVIGHPWKSGALLLAVSFIVSVFVPIPKSELSPLPVVSLRITDRNDETLREVLSDQEGRAYWLRPEEIPPQLINATIAAEDKYFYYHPGINPLAVARALFQDVTAMRLVSGGSTITQQVIRNMPPHVCTSENRSPISRSRKRLFSRQCRTRRPVRIHTRHSTGRKQDSSSY
ncbi:MAG: hypothetical protein B7Z63_05930 [Ignavibacteriae bacterium 37-53-5]|nr:MAG: hypothetical protein B7Z63_05930 [Ignavibacteriae bacterium 37-53-5]